MSSTMSSTAESNMSFLATAYTIAQLLPKCTSHDSDFRFMALNDLHNILATANNAVLLNDHQTSLRVVEAILKTLDDQNGEVQNMAVKCLGPLVGKLPSNILNLLLNRLSNFTTEKSFDRSISFTAIRTIVASLPRPVPGAAPSKGVEGAYLVISGAVIPQMVRKVAIPRAEEGSPVPRSGLRISRSEQREQRERKLIEAETIDVLIEVVRCYGPMLAEAEVSILEHAVTDLLDNAGTTSVAKKRAVVALSALAVYFSDGLLSAFVSKLIESFRDPHLTPVRRRLLITLAGAMARSIPHTFGPYLKTLAPFILSAVSEAELADQAQNAAEDGETDPEADDVREAALSTLESFLVSCSTEMRLYTGELIQAALCFLKYDPNLAQGEDDTEMGTQDPDNEDDGNDFDMEEDFEDDGNLSDGNDISWKVRRCAVKLIYALISTKSSRDLLDKGVLYDKVAQALLERFREREENVRLEVLTTMSTLIRTTGQRAGTEDSNVFDESRALAGQAQSRKRRRGGSDASMFEMQGLPSSPTDAGLLRYPTPSFGPHASLVKMSPSIVEAATRLLKSKSVPTKQASMTLLKYLVTVQRGGLTEHLNEITDHIAESMRSPGGAHAGTGFVAPVTGAFSGTGNNGLRLEALSLAALIVESHQAKVLRPFAEKLVPEVATTVKDKYYKVSSEALHVVEQFVKILTPPRSQAQDLAQPRMLEELYDIITERVAAADADGEVRQQAIHALGILLSRTSGSQSTKFLSQAKRFAALDLLTIRIKGETTRFSAIRAIGEVASYASVQDDFSPAWVRNVSFELGEQLRKVSRSLRAASLTALKNIIINPVGRGHLSVDTSNDLVYSLLPLLTANDLHLLGPTLIVLANLIKGGGVNSRVDQDMIKAICSLTLAQLSGAVLDALLILVKNIGEENAGRPLMQSLLKDVGVSGDAVILGKVIGTLQVAGGPQVGIKLEDFVAELQGARDDKRKVLALSVLGEAGLRLGASSPLTPNIFMAHFQSKSDRVPLAAAVALGRAGAGNVQLYLPVILQALDEPGKSQYLLLHSIEEILKYAADASIDLSPYSKRTWDKLLQTAQSEDNRVVGAECIGRLTLIDPQAYFGSLQSHLNDRKASVRGMIIQAIRYALSDSDDSYDGILQSAIVDMLTTMLSDPDIDNARLALKTLISAAIHKPYIILPHLGQFLPFVMKASVVKRELIREVQMGPFKHKVDDGLELRKSAYETLFALMDTAFRRMNAVELYDRVMAGLEDEHDVRVLCHIMLTKLIVLEPDETHRRLDQIAERFRNTLSFKSKENTVKQELEKAQEASKGVIRVSILLHRAFPHTTGAASKSAAAPGHAQLWRTYWEWLLRDFGAVVRDIEGEREREIMMAKNG